MKQKQPCIECGHSGVEKWADTRHMKRSNDKGEIIYDDSSTKLGMGCEQCGRALKYEEVEGLP